MNYQVVRVVLAVFMSIAAGLFFGLGTYVWLGGNFD